MEANCPVCAVSPLLTTQNRQMWQYFECPTCGPYALTLTALAVAQNTFRLDDDKVARAKLGHAIYQMHRGRTGKWAEISDELLRAILRGTLPVPSEQLDNLVAWVGSKGRPGTRVDAGASAVFAIGAIDFGGFALIAGEARSRGLIDCEIREVKGQREDHLLVTPMHLTFGGLNRIEELRRAGPGSRIAFMAMPFGKSELDAMYFEHFQTAVRATGFTLKRLDEDQPAGLIDDHLRVEIRQCRFLIADLTHGNSGAYWEAGFAEGLDKPVIYTCEKSVFDDRMKGTHFDTNHHLTVVWEASSPAAAVNKLKATIRATLPNEAVLSD